MNGLKGVRTGNISKLFLIGDEPWVSVNGRTFLKQRSECWIIVIVLNKNSANVRYLYI
jgi:hypothetical protein